MPWIFFLLPWLELWTLIELGAATSGLAALAYVFLTLVLGMTMIRRQGLNLLQQMQREADSGFFSPRLLMDDLALVTSGLLLMVPGLITDFFALLMLFGPLRRKLLGLGNWQVHRGRGFRGAGNDIPGETSTETRTDIHITMEGDYRRVDD